MTGPPRNVDRGGGGSSDYFQCSAGVTDFFGVYAHASEHGEVEVGERRFLGHDDVPSGSEGAAAATCEKDGQVVVVVAVRIGNARAKDNHGMIEQSAAPFLDGLELFQEISELSGVKFIHFGQHFEFFGAVLVVGESMVGVIDTDLRERAIGAVVSQQK